MHRLTLLGICVLLSLSSSIWAQPHFAFHEPVTPARPVQVMVHRGLSTIAPENSAPAIEKCIEDYLEWVEIDVRLTKDGHHVLVHNSAVDGVTSGTGKVSELTLDQLKELDAGTWFAPRFAGTKILTLAEALALAKGRINLLIDCKTIDAKKLVEEILATGMERQVVVYDDVESLAEIREHARDKVARMAKYRKERDVDSFIREVAPAAVEINAEDITSELCQRFHQAGMKVQAQTLGAARDNPHVWQKVIADGVDWIQTDDPAAVRFFDAHRRIGQFPVMIACHRAASRYAPENTIPSIQIAAKLGIDYAEIDIRTTKDGQFVLVHDGQVTRTTTAKGPVRDFTFDEIHSLSAGTWFGKPFQETKVPSFDEGLEQYGPHMGAYLDAKDIAPEALVAFIQKYDLAKRHVVYQSLEYCEKLRAIDPTVRIMPPLRRIEDVPNVAKAKPFAVDAAWAALSADSIAECHRHDIKVFSDALGKNESVEEYLRAIGWGIDCIQTDHPLRVLRAIELATATKQ